MNQALESCIMPTVNRQKFIPYAIEYFLQQDYLNTELIIIDDGLESAKHLIPNHSKIKYFYSEPLGIIGIKRNKACEKAKGEIIMHWEMMTGMHQIGSAGKLTHWKVLKQILQDST